MNDTLVNEIANVAVSVASASNGGELLPGVHNNVTSSLLTAVIMTIYGFIHRAIEKKKLRKKGKLVD